MRILYVDIDTLRPDHLGCYGYPRATSTNIDKVAEDSVRFTDVYCSDAPCLPSRAALMTGRFGIHTGCVGHGGVNAEMRWEGRNRGMADFNGRYNLPAVLRRAGMKPPASAASRTATQRGGSTAALTKPTTSASAAWNLPTR